MTPEQLTLVVAAGISWICSRFPGIATWFEKLDSDRKQFLMLGATTAFAIGATAWGCWGGEIVCTNRDTWGATAKTILLAWGVNQATHRLTPERKPEPPRRKHKPVVVGKLPR